MHATFRHLMQEHDSVVIRMKEWKAHCLICTGRKLPARTIAAYLNQQKLINYSWCVCDIITNLWHCRKNSEEPNVAVNVCQPGSPWKTRNTRNFLQNVAPAHFLVKRTLTMLSSTVITGVREDFLAGYTNLSLGGFYLTYLLVCEIFSAVVREFQRAPHVVL